MARTKAAALAAAGGPTPTPSKPSSRNGSGLGSANKNKNENENDTDQKTPIGPLGVTPLPAHAREVVKVNNASVGDLKNACDDAVKRFLSRPELFKQIYTHTDVRLALGWLSVFVAGGTAFYGYKVEFEASKGVVGVGLVLYMLLTALSTLYAYFVEGETVFVGKRKTFSKRIITERITLSSRTLPASSSSSSSSNSSQTSSTSTTSKSAAPAYSVSLHYVRSTNGGKTLLGRGRARGSAGFERFFDENGVMDQEGFERWVGGLVEEGMEGKSA